MIGHEAKLFLAVASLFAYGVAPSGASPYERPSFDRLAETANDRVEGQMHGTATGASSDPIGIGLRVVAAGLAAPLSVTHAGDGSGRLFIVDQIGLIRVVDADGNLLVTPFLDVQSKLVTLGALFDERGLLGMAFHPDYASNGRFFIRYSAPRIGGPDEPCTTSGFNPGCHEAILAEYRVQGDPLTSNVANPASEQILFRFDEPQFNHDGGDVAFGPDGLLYFALGDGGGANDGLADVPPSHGPNGNGQNVATALGSMLRIDVDSPDSPGLDYAIPPGNPFAGGGGAPEIYAYGFRNPYRFSFDDGPGGDGSIYVGDVGQDVFEEVDVLPQVAAPGLLNHGWVIREGFQCFDPFNPSVPPAGCSTVGPLGEPLLDPVMDYTHAAGGLSVIGGFVYRGARNSELVGKYIFGDFSAAFFIPSGRLYYFDTSGSEAFVRREFNLLPNGAPFGQFLKGFGKDEDGELYVCASLALDPSGDTGVVYRIVQANNAIPTVSEWGLVILVLVLLILGKIIFRTYRRV